MSTITVFIIILVLAGAALHQTTSLRGRATVAIVTVNVKSKKK